MPPPPMLWTIRRPVYRVNLALLLSMTPFNVLSMALPYWLGTQAKLHPPSTSGSVSGSGSQDSKQGVYVNYGIWRQCSDDTGCLWVYDDVIDTHVGGWMYPITIFMLLSSVCHLVAAIMGSCQNFLSRNFSRRLLRWKFFKTVLHRDAPFVEDIGFLAGFFGTVSCIIFMLCTKDDISDGARYQWAFAVALISSTTTVVASLTLTKSHLLTVPRPPTGHRRPWGASSSPSASDPPVEAAAAAAASSSPHPLQQRPAVRPEDVQLQERGAAGRSSSGSRDAFHRFPSSSSSSSRRRRSSRSRSRSRDHSGSRRSRSRSRPRPQQGQSRLVRSLEVENIPAAVTPSSSFQCPPCTSQAASSLRRTQSSSGPVMCLEMADLQARATSSQPELVAGPAAKAKDAPTGGGGAVPESPKKAEARASSSDVHRSQPEVVLAVAPLAFLQGHNSLASASGTARERDAADSDMVMTAAL